MIEELNINQEDNYSENKQEVKDQEDVIKHDVKKKTNKKRELEIIEQYHYNEGENESLIMDKPSEPLKKEKNKNIEIKDMPKKVQVILPKVEVKSNKELYESYIRELKNFILSLNGDIIYDSSIDKSKESPLFFENDFFSLYGKKYSYNGLKIQKINKK